MRTANQKLARERGFKLIELMITTAIVGITGTIVYYLLYTGLTLFAKNTAINSAHQEARVAVMQMEQDLHGAISIPQLTDGSGNPIAGSGPAAGITFQLFAEGPYQVTPLASNPYFYSHTSNQITVRCGNYSPASKQRLIIPLYQIENDISTASGLGVDKLITMADANNNVEKLGVDVYTQLGSPAADVNVQCFITDRVTYLVQGTQLLYYGRKGATPKVMANDITTATPFSIPATPLGAPFNRFVAAINLSTADLTSNNRHFKAANMFLNAMEPYRARLCIYQ
jgi:prepilin-type N-terminal cleavage/methylation domain-containing protein